MVSGDKLLGPRGRDTRHNARPVAKPSSVQRPLLLNTPLLELSILNYVFTKLYLVTAND